MDRLLEVGGIEVMRVVLGPLQTNTYVHVCDGEALVVDPAWPDPRLAESVKGKPVRVIDTHGHLDHVAGNVYLRESAGAAIHIHRDDAYMLEEIDLPLIRAMVDNGLIPFTPHRPDRTFVGGERLDVCGHMCEVIHVPGHTRGSIVVYCADMGIAYVGDLIFRGSIGRVDFPHSDPLAMANSLRRVLSTIDRNAVLLPGHGPPTVLREERDLLERIAEILEVGRR